MDIFIKYKITLTVNVVVITFYFIMLVIWTMTKPPLPRIIDVNGKNDFNQLYAKSKNTLVDILNMLRGLKVFIYFFMLVLGCLAIINNKWIEEDFINCLIYFFVFGTIEMFHYNVVVRDYFTAIDSFNVWFKSTEEETAVVFFSNESNIKGDVTTCSICLGTKEQYEHLRVLPCGHQFHSECIHKYTLTASSAIVNTKESQANCPICRRYYYIYMVDKQNVSILNE